ncbi:hypothetical protein GCM10023220_55870 [Streptomyces ziwulingensis]|uniref:Winged helix-turn helix domain-containing protein n=1 Tax=Streptomyces ziwulingensis TaxID=1045501 RepID=A0ABP9CU65_9ACTN
MIGRRFHLACTLQSVRKLLVRDGWSCQVPARRAVERDDEAVAGWVKETWPCGEDSRWPVEPGSSSRTKPASLYAAAGQDLVTAWPHPSGASPRAIPQTHLHLRAELLQAQG